MFIVEHHQPNKSTYTDTIQSKIDIAVFFLLSYVQALTSATNSLFSVYCILSIRLAWFQECHRAVIDAHQLTFYNNNIWDDKCMLVGTYLPTYMLCCCSCIKLQVEVEDDEIRDKKNTTQQPWCIIKLEP